jgi:hypothetical protein
MDLLHLIYSSNFLLTYATITAVLIVLMVIINVYDYYKITKPYRDIEKKYKNKGSL